MKRKETITPLNPPENPVKGLIEEYKRLERKEPTPEIKEKMLEIRRKYLKIINK